MIHDLGPLRYPERLHPRTVRCTPQPPCGRDAATSFHQRGLHGERRRRAARDPAGAHPVAYPGVDARYRPDGERHEIGAHTSSRPRPRTGGRTAASSGRSRGCSVDELALLSLGHGGSGYVADDELPRALPRGGGLRLPVALRGLRDAGRRGDGLRRPASSPPSVAGRGLRGRRGSRRSGEPGGDRRGDQPRAGRRDELVARGLAHARRFKWLETGRIHLRSYLTRCDERRDRRLAARPDPRGNGALSRRG